MIELKEKERISLNEILAPDEQEEAKQMAMKIGAILGNANRSVIQHALSLALASAELIEFCPSETRESLIDFFNITIRTTLEAFAEHDRIKARH